MNKKAKITLFVLFLGIFLASIFAFSIVLAKPNLIVVKECKDRIDNDHDGKIDLADAGCANSVDLDESNCGDGVCEGGENYVNCLIDCGYPDSCNDSDNGLNFIVAGAILGYLNNQFYSIGDYCIDSSNLNEYYCSGNYGSSQQQNCGNDYYGANYCSNGSVYRSFNDYFCASGKCDSSVSSQLVEECNFGCINGTCNPIPNSCTDSDGNNWLTQGTVNGTYLENPYSYIDFCATENNLVEFYCYNTLALNFTFDCAINYTSCSNGRCI